MRGQKGVADHEVLDQVRFDAAGLIPAIVQEARTGEVLMLAYMNEASLRKTLETGTTWFFSRSRQSLWQKGESSGNVQRVVDVQADCDYDALLVRVEQMGTGACHLGERTCFHRPIVKNHRPTDAAGGQADDSNNRHPKGHHPSGRDQHKHDGAIVQHLYDVIRRRQREPVDGSYTTYLFREGMDKILKKVGEESTEVIIAAKGGDREGFVAESADFMYHLLVLMAELGVEPQSLWQELEKRRGGGGTEDTPPEK